MQIMTVTRGLADIRRTVGLNTLDRVARIERTGRDALVIRWGYCHWIARGRNGARYKQ